jgi:hypothetical protein
MLAPAKTLARKLLPAFAYQRLIKVYGWLTRESVPKITPLKPRREWNQHQHQNYIWFEHAQKYLQVNRIDGVYVEFGCHEVNTFRFALNTLGRYRMPNDIHHFYAFDSFAGMPEPTGIDKQKIWRKGMNHTSLDQFRTICRLDLHRITVVPGFFAETLPAAKWNEDHKIALAYIDVDYYSSTKDVLAFIAGKLQHGSIIAFDDWNCYYADPARGQRRAFSEWQRDLGGMARFEPFLQISWCGMSFIYQETGKVGTPVL